MSTKVIKKGNNLLSANSKLLKPTLNGTKWGEIGGNIDSQIDLKDKLNTITNIANGKTKTYVVNYTDSVNTLDYTKYRKVDGTDFKSSTELSTYISGYTCYNSIFNSQDDIVNISVQAEPLGIDKYLLLKNANLTYIVKYAEQSTLLKVGDILLVEQTDVPDRWYSGYVQYYKMETSKVDLTQYYTKTQVDNKNYIKTTNTTPISLKFQKLTETEYESLTTKDTDTLYLIVEEE